MGVLSNLFGKKPTIPTLPTLEQAQTGALKANVASFADIAKLATQVDTYNQDQLAALMEKQLPGGAGKIRDTISSQLSGEIPKDVLRQIRNTIAERGGALTRGSPFQVGVEAQKVGLTSLDIMEKGFNSAMKWMQQTSTPTFDVTSMFLTPAQKRAEQLDQWNRDTMQAKINAAPDPGIRGIFDTGMQVLGMALSAYGGGPGYTGTYNPASATAGPSSTWGIGGSGFGFGTTSSPTGRSFFLGSQPGRG